ncbi:alpha/beta fold hydrolase [Undibacterium terreum]|uniref:Hydrolase n=1 Tax=Undibacterium terreum TaxID=1224302 RepID=A0A916V0K9_9BURK|nr:alpha/beta hydrolase [Undibacterium terreum]GGC96523.1 hydrolase [Undibacterium terreum]
MRPSSHYLTIHQRELHYLQWGSPHKPTVLLSHGLARTSRDFDDLAAALAGDYHVIVPDMLGRGLSQWSPEPQTEYCLEFYVKLLTGLADQLAITSMRWVGTSMGGAIGMLAAATTLRDRITHLVLNDNGPQLAETAINRIRSYAGSPASFNTVTELEAYFRQIYTPYGWLSDEQWRRLTESSVRRLPDGKVTPHYDPNMVMQFIEHENDYLRWDEYDSLSCKTLVLRGESSDLLLADTAQAMTQRGPKATLVTVAGCGHAPALNVLDQITIVRDFLR